MHHERPYFSEHTYDDASVHSQSYYEGLIGYYDDHQDLGSTNGEELSESNDIQFSINDDLQFKIETEDNYNGRDIDVGIVLPDGLPNTQAAALALQ